MQSEPITYTSAERAEARALIYRVAQCVTAGYPTRANMDVVFGDTVREAFGIFAGDDDLARYEAHGKSYRKNPFSWIDKARSDYTRLFIGPGDLKALPWESCYAGEGRLIFQAPVLEVRAAYREQGFEPLRKNKVPDDHLSLELGFMAELAARGDKSSDEAARRFLREHLMKWLPAYCVGMEGGGEEGFYVDAVRFITAFCRADSARRALAAA